jgi:hypothetical protein
VPHLRSSRGHAQTQWQITANVSLTFFCNIDVRLLNRLLFQKKYILKQTDTVETRSACGCGREPRSPRACWLFATKLLLTPTAFSLPRYIALGVKILNIFIPGRRPVKGDSSRLTAIG